MDYSALLGQYFSEPSISIWLDQLGISDVPRLSRGDDTTYLSNPTLGIELTFEDSESLSDPKRDYPDGALVLSNIRFYGIKTEGFSTYKGDLPFDIIFGMPKSELLLKFGEPNWKNPRSNKLRWEFEDFWLLVSLDSSDKVEIVSLQLPM